MSFLKNIFGEKEPTVSLEKSQSPRELTLRCEGGKDITVRTIKLTRETMFFYGENGEVLEERSFDEIREVSSKYIPTLYQKDSPSPFPRWTFPEWIRDEHRQEIGKWLIGELNLVEKTEYREHPSGRGDMQVTVYKRRS